LLSNIPKNEIAHLTRISANGRTSMRFFGILFNPGILGWICIIIIFSPFYRLIKKGISLISLYLTGARLFYPGMMLVYYTCIRKKNKPIVFFFMIFMVFLIVIYFIKNMDPSLQVHVDHFFVKGPGLVIENFMGIGFDKSIGLESDIYMTFIRFGIWGGLIYIYVFILLYKYFNNKKIRDNKIIIYGKNLTIIFFLASLVLPLQTLRVLSNIYWIFVSLIYAQVSMILNKKELWFKFNNTIWNIYEKKYS
jgi:hypothetical protein